MLNSAVDSIVQELNQFIGMKFQIDEDVVILSNLMNLDGTVAAFEPTDKRLNLGPCSAFQQLFQHLA